MWDHRDRASSKPPWGGPCCDAARRRGRGDGLALAPRDHVARALVPEHDRRRHLRAAGGRLPPLVARGGGLRGRGADAGPGLASAALPDRCLAFMAENPGSEFPLAVFPLDVWVDRDCNVQFWQGNWHPDVRLHLDVPHWLRRMTSRVSRGHAPSDDFVRDFALQLYDPEPGRRARAAPGVRGRVQRRHGDGGAPPAHRRACVRRYIPCAATLRTRFDGIFAHYVRGEAGGGRGVADGAGAQAVPREHQAPSMPVLPRGPLSGLLQVQDLRQIDCRFFSRESARA